MLPCDFTVTKIMENIHNPSFLLCCVTEGWGGRDLKSSSNFNLSSSPLLDMHTELTEAAIDVPFPSAHHHPPKVTLSQGYTFIAIVSGVDN